MKDTPVLAISQKFNGILKNPNAGDHMVAFFNTAPFLNTWAGVHLKDYYYNPAVKMAVQLDFQAAFDQAICIPGVWADFGALLEPSAFGCEIAWPSQDGMPMAKPVINSEADIGRIRPVDPHKDGLMPRALDDFRYFWDHMDHGLIEQYGFLDGVAVTFGPVELGAMIMGHSEFFMTLGMNPAALHQLFEVTTESVINWLRACQGVNGTLKRIVLADHIPGQVSAEHVEEFFIPYTKQVMDEFPNAYFTWHNEYPIPYPEVLQDMGFSMFHFGGDIRQIQPTIGRNMILMGNLDPIDLLHNEDPEDIYQKARACLEQGMAERSFLLSTGGGLAPGTPEVNLRAMVRAVEDFQAKVHSSYKDAGNG